MTRVAAALSPFEAMAEGYDRDFTSRPIASLLRRAVWRRLDRAFPPGSRALELGCGTGEDAVHLAARGVRVLATDAAAAMCAEAARKAERAGLEHLVEVRRMRAEEAASLEGRFDGAFSDFGVLNCVERLDALAAALAGKLPAGAPLLLCVMGRHAPAEWLHFLRRGEPARAFRRLGKGPHLWRGLTIRYPTIGEVARAFAPAFVLERAAALGAIVPPPFAEEWGAEHPELLATLDACERLLETVPPLPSLADHVLLELRRA